MVAIAKKDARALLPAWFAAVAAQSIAAIAPGGDWYSWETFALLTYSGAVLEIGALTVGHEYTHGTVSSLLALPIRRRKVFLIKFAIAGSLILSLGGIVWTLRVLPSPPIVVLPVLGAFFLAPWLTMLCRSPLAGAVFTVAVAAILFLVSQVIAAKIYGSTPEASALARTWWYGAMVVMLPVTGALGWRQFMRLEAIEGPGQSIHVPNWMRLAREGRPRHPVWMLMKKEVYLHQIAFAVAGLYVAVWTALFPLGVLPDAPGRTLALMPMTALYFVMLALVIGSMASAEERQHGTREWHLILPMAAWRQWVIKVGVAVGLAVALGVALPSVLWLISGTVEEQRLGSWVWRSAILPVMAITALAIYVSSTTTSGLRALLVAVPTIGAYVIFVQMMNSYTWFGMSRLWAPAYRGDVVTLACAAGVLLLLLWFAFTNHIVTQPSKRRIAGQVATVAVLVALAIAILGPI